MRDNYSFICWLHYYILLQTHHMFMPLPGKLAVSWFWCLVTGFYPSDINMNIRLDRINIKSQISFEIKPKYDKSFQLRASVELDRKVIYINTSHVTCFL